MCNIGCLQENEEGVCMLSPFKTAFCFIAILDAYEFSEIDDLIIEELAEKGKVA